MKHWLGFYSVTPVTLSPTGGGSKPRIKHVLDILFTLALVAERQCVDAHHLVGVRRYAPHIQTQELTLVKHRAYMFPPRLGDSEEVREFVVNVIELDAPGACSCRVWHVIGAGLTADGYSMRRSYTSGLVLVGHCDPLGLDHVLISLLVAFVEDEAVALGCKRDEQDSWRKSLSSLPQHPIPDPSCGHYSG
jgi:hypothetical protein